MARAVLLLPVPRLPVVRTQLWAEYRSAVEKTLKDLSSTSSSSKTLDLALVLNGGSHERRSQLFAALQNLLADTYTLICTIASRLKVDLDFTGGVDVRCFVVDGALEATGSQDFQQHPCDGPLPTMGAFLRSRLPYGQVFSLMSAEEIKSCAAAEFHQHLTGASTIFLQQSSFGSSIIAQATISAQALDTSNERVHTRVAVGGTFDHLHIGHKLLLTATVLIAQPGSADREITIGITGDELLVNKKHAEVLESWDIRQQRCADFAESILVFDTDIESYRQVTNVDEPGPNGKVVKVTYTPPAGGKVTINYTRISDPFGPTITDKSITALVISGETRAGGKAVNDKRAEKGWDALEVFEVNVLDPGAADLEGGQEPSSTKSTFESKISSTEIRKRLAAETTSKAATS